MQLHASLNVYLNLIRWNRPAGTLLLLWPTLSALWLARTFASQPLPLTMLWHVGLVFIFGTFLMRSAGCCINDIADRHLDGYVQRTRQRPLATGQLGVKHAAIFGILLALLALLFVLSLALTLPPAHLSNLLWLCLLAVIITAMYPFTKRFFSMPQAVLGLAFGMGILMAFVALNNSIPTEALWLYLANFFWVLAYDTQYAMVDKPDDVKIGIHTSAITLGKWDVSAILLFYALYLCISMGVFLYPKIGQLQKWQWAWLGFFGLLAIAQIICHGILIWHREPKHCFLAFTNNHWLGLTFLLAILCF